MLGHASTHGPSWMCGRCSRGGHRLDRPGAVRSSGSAPTSASSRRCWRISPRAIPQELSADRDRATCPAARWRDACRSRSWMRRTAGTCWSTTTNAVQVYLLMREVTDAAVEELTSAGVSIEIVDAPGRRLQARVPASRLQRVASLASVGVHPAAELRAPARGRNSSPKAMRFTPPMWRARSSARPAPASASA